MADFPLYSIKQYRDDLYKVIRFKRSGGAVERENDVDTIVNRSVNDSKLENNIIRARSNLLQYALCNEWDYFFTGTLDSSKYDRFDLDNYVTDLSQFVRDLRKKYRSSIQYLFVPERHKDGAWHIHGMLSGISDLYLTSFSYPAPERLIRGGFLNWPDYQNKFGFCSLGKIRSPIGTAFYISKYISKSMADRASDYGRHLYFHSRPLKKVEVTFQEYFDNPVLSSYCVSASPFCVTGWSTDKWLGLYCSDYQWDIPIIVRNSSPDSSSVECLLSADEVHFDPLDIDPFYQESVPGWWRCEA